MAGRLEQSPHVGLKDVVFHKMIDDVQRERKVRPFSGISAHCAERSGLVRLEPLAAFPYGGAARVKPEVRWVFGKTKLVAVSTSKFDHCLHVMCRDEFAKALEIIAEFAIMLV